MGESQFSFRYFTCDRGIGPFLNNINILLSTVLTKSLTESSTVDGSKFNENIRDTTAGHIRLEWFAIGNPHYLSTDDMES